MIKIKPNKTEYTKKLSMEELMNLDKVMDDIIPNFKMKDPVKKEEIKIQYWKRPKDKKNTIDTATGLF